MKIATDEALRNGVPGINEASLAYPFRKYTGRDLNGKNYIAVENNHVITGGEMFNRF